MKSYVLMLNLCLVATLASCGANRSRLNKVASSGSETPVESQGLNQSNDFCTQNPFHSDCMGAFETGSNTASDLGNTADQVVDSPAQEPLSPLPVSPTPTCQSFNFEMMRTLEMQLIVDPIRGNISDVWGSRTYNFSLADSFPVTAPQGQQYLTHGSVMGNFDRYGDCDDNIRGTSSVDLIMSGAGEDMILAHEGNDVIFSNQGRDYIHAGQGNDEVYAGQGNDTVYGGQGNDKLYGNMGMDSIYGNQGNDLIYGNEGIDIIHGGQDNDEIYGNQDNDFLHGGLGNDYLHGGQGNDLVLGGDGNDILHGGEGTDYLIGGNGTDSYFISGNQTYIMDEGVAYICLDNGLVIHSGATRMDYMVTQNNKLVNQYILETNQGRAEIIAESYRLVSCSQ